MKKGLINIHFTVKMMGSSNNRILEEVMPLRIIREIEKWPVIYKRDSPEMANPRFRYKIWEEVAKNVFENFQIYSAEEKEARVTSLMKKWRNLRDTFKRQVMVEKKIRQGHNIKKKEYVYYKHMSFLLPYMRDEPREAGASGAGSSRRARCGLPPPPPADHSLEHIDEDRHFLLSLLPSFKRMSDDEKLTAKMEILKVIKHVKHGSMALNSFVADDSLALPDAPLDEDVVVKEELLVVDTADYKSPNDFSSCDTE